MKKSLIIAGFALGAIVIGTSNVNAQNHSANTEVNIKLNDVISIDAGSTSIGGKVDFNFLTAADYNNGLIAPTVINALVVTSTKNFDVNVKADGVNFVNGTNVIPVDVLKINANSFGTSAQNTMGGTKNSLQVSSTQDQKLVDNAPLGSARSLNITYSIPAAESSSNKILGKPAGTYTQNITYTATVH